MRIAVLFDGAGLARLGLEQAGHECTGYELDPTKHHLSKYIGSGNCVLADARDADLSGFDAIWASPPCQELSSARTQGKPTSPYAENLLDWALSLKLKYPDKVNWIENVYPQGPLPDWGKPFNAAQFEVKPRQNRSRIIGGRYIDPSVIRSFQRQYNRMGICPTITASEYKGCASDERRASRWYRRRLTIEECAYHQGLDHIPDEWFIIPDWYVVPPHKTGSRQKNWRHNLYEAIGNGVPVYMAKAFGEAFNSSVKRVAQMQLF